MGGRTGGAAAAPRILGLDVARGLAVLGMFAAHTVRNPELRLDLPQTWTGIVDGRSAVLFAVLAGVAVAILSGGAAPVGGTALREARTRILVRALLVLVLGGLLTALGTSIAVVLQVYAVLFAMSLPLLTWRASRLFPAAAIAAVVGPVVAVVVGAFAAARDPHGVCSGVVDLLATGPYPALVWVAYLLLGLGVGRLALDRTGVQGALVTVGAGLAAVGYGTAMLLAPLRARLAVEAADPGAVDLPALLSAAPHANTTLEAVGSGGVALAVIGGSLLLLRLPVAVVLLAPLWALGQMALTAYTVQVIAYWAYERTTGAPPDDWAVFWWFAGVALVVATVWRLGLRRRGPLEQLLSAASRRAAEPRRPGGRGAAPAGRLLDRPGEGATGPVIDKE